MLRLLYRKLHVAVYHSSLTGPSRDRLVRGPGPAGTGGHTRVHPTQKCRPRRRDEGPKQRSLSMGLRDCKLNEENGWHPRGLLCDLEPDTYKALKEAELTWPPAYPAGPLLWSQQEE